MGDRRVLEWDVEAPRARARLAARGRATAADFAVVAACCCWPIALSLFIGLTVVETSIAMWRSP